MSREPLERWVDLRRRLHRIAERSGEERKTAGLIAEELARCHPDRLLTGIAGTGVAAVFEGKRPGPRVLLRCELDALPIPERGDLPYTSKNPEVSHRCGHDGHMAMVTALAPELAESRPESGAVILLYQPAEETGNGSRLVMESEPFVELAPDRVFAVHNLPGYPLGEVVIRAGVFAAESCGMIADFTGEPSHAAEPHLGRSPTMAILQCATSLTTFAQRHVGLGQAAKVTVTHIQLGEPCFGITPGEGRVTATLRSHSSEVMSHLRERCVSLVKGLAATYEVEAAVGWTEEFPLTVNDPEEVARIIEAAEAQKLPVRRLDAPLPWSEDFGHLTGRFRGALIGLGAGETCPALHRPDYDFPEALLPIGRNLLRAVVRSIVDPSG
jgi:amidohydrolase